MCRNKKTLFSHELLVGMQKDFGRQVSYKTKHTCTLQSCNHAPWYLPKGTENLCPQILTNNAYSSCIHNCQNLKKPRCSSVVGEWMWYIQLYQWSIIQHYKEKSYEAMKRCRETLNIITKYKKPIFFKHYL